MLSQLWKRAARPRPADSRPLAVTVYSRSECGCCHKALALLEGYQRDGKVEVRVVDVDSDADLAARFGTSVPVVEINGKVRFKGLVNPVLLDRIVRAEGDPSS